MAGLSCRREATSSKWRCDKIHKSERGLKMGLHAGLERMARVCLVWGLVACAFTGNGQGQQSNPCAKILELVADVRMPGQAVRFDYQSMDAQHGRLYIAHMNADQLVVFDTKKREVVANLDGFPNVHGVWAVPDLGRVYASATGEHKVA